MLKREIYFGVVEGDRCASIWKLKTNKKTPDVYLSSNQLGTIHASMHKDGNWHLKFGKMEEKIRTSIGQEMADTYMEKWKRPEETKPKITIAFRIHTPHPTPRKKKSLIKKDFVEIPNAPAGSAKEIIIFFVALKADLTIKNADLVGKINLPNGEIVVITHKTVDIKPPDNLHKQKLSLPDITDRISFKDLVRGNLGAILFGKASDGSRIMWDIAINISFSGYIKIIKLKIIRLVKN
jgi:hypothetical protein